MKYIISFILIFVISFTFIQFHENSHIAVFKNYGCEIERTLFTVDGINCPEENIETINYLNTQLESRYIDIYFYVNIITILTLILISKEK